jgi:hypothetical protein
MLPNSVVFAATEPPLLSVAPVVTVAVAPAAGIERGIVHLCSWLY